jgi:hypothetical protein
LRGQAQPFIDLRQVLDSGPGLAFVLEVPIKRRSQGKALASGWLQQGGPVQGLPAIGRR